MTRQLSLFSVLWLDWNGAEEGMEFIFIYVACPQVCVSQTWIIDREDRFWWNYFPGRVQWRMCHGVMLFRGVKSCLCGRCLGRLVFTLPIALCICRRNVFSVCVQIPRRRLVCFIVPGGLNYSAREFNFVPMTPIKSSNVLTISRNGGWFRLLIVFPCSVWAQCRSEVRWINLKATALLTKFELISLFYC